MGTTLSFIANSKQLSDITPKKCEAIKAELDKLNFKRVLEGGQSHVAEEGAGQWQYDIVDFKAMDGYITGVEFDGPFLMYFIRYSNITVVDTLFRYHHLYSFSDWDGLKGFRKDIFNLLGIIDATEIIYLADNGADKLDSYLSNLAHENVPYHIIKAKMISELGNPIKDYGKLNIDTLDYKKYKRILS